MKGFLTGLKHLRVLCYDFYMVTNFFCFALSFKKTLHFKTDKKKLVIVYKLKIEAVFFYARLTVANEDN